MGITQLWDYVNSVWRDFRGDDQGRAVTVPMAQYQETPGTLDDGEYSPLTLTVDKKLRSDDPTTQEKVDAAIAILEDVGFGNAAIRDAIIAGVTVIFEEATSGLDALAALINALPPVPERGTNDAARRSDYTAPRAISLEKLGRSLEAYTYQYGFANDNGTSAVTVLNVSSGRGILVGCGAGTNVGTEFKLTVDGVVVVNYPKMNFTVEGSSAAWFFGPWIPFTTSLEVKMRCTANRVAYYWAVAAVE